MPTHRLTISRLTISLTLLLAGVSTCLPSSSSVPVIPPSVPIPDPPAHPRVFLAPGDLETLRNDCLLGPKQWIYHEIRRRAESKLPDPGKVSLNHLANANAAFVYLIENDERFGRVAADGLMALVRRGRWNTSQSDYWGMALTYDHIFPLLSQAQVDSVARVVRSRIGPGHILKSPYYNLEANDAAAVFVTGVTFYGDCTDARVDQHFRDLIADGFGRFMGEGSYDEASGRAPFKGGVLPVRLHHNGDGGYQKDRAYTGKDLGSLVHFAEASRGIDMFDVYAHAERYFTNVVDYLLWSTRPDGLALRQMTGQGYQTVTARTYEGLAGIARHFHDGHAAWLIENEMTGSGHPPTYDAVAFAMLWDPTVEPEAPTVETMGRWKLYGAEGLPHVPGTSSAERLIYRSGWQIDGRSEDFLFHLDATDYLGDNVYWTVGGFELFHRGALAIKSGYYGEANEHYEAYQKASISANTIVIRKPGAVPDTGLQDDIRDVSGTPASLSDLVDGSPFDRGGIDSVRVVSLGGREWVLGSAVFDTDAIYRESKRARSWERRVAVTDGIAIIYDRIEPRDVESDVSWLLHTVEEPVVSGDVRAVDVPGHVTWHTGDTFRVSRMKRFANFPNGGTMRGTRLLPLVASTRKVGGDGYSFWVDEARPERGKPPVGRNYAIDDPDARFTEREAGGWRIEIHATERREVVEFLVVLDSRAGVETPAGDAFVDERTAGLRVNGGVIGFAREPSPGARFRVLR